MLHVLAFAIYVVVEMTPGIRRMAERANMALIENANLCILPVYKVTIYVYCKILPKDHSFHCLFSIN